MATRDTNQVDHTSLSLYEAVGPHRQLDSRQLDSRQLVNRQLVSQGGSPTEDREILAAFSLTRTKPAGSARVFATLQGVTRVVVVLFYLFPLLLLPKIVLWATESWFGDLITIAFVGLTVLLFNLIAVVVILHAIVGKRSERRGQVCLDEVPPELDTALAWLERDPLPLTPAAELARCAESGSQKPLRLRGKIVATRALAADEPVLHDSWLAGSSGDMLRLCRGEAFLLQSEGMTPALVELHAPPIVLARYVKSAESALPAACRRIIATLSACSDGPQQDWLAKGVAQTELSDAMTVELAVGDIVEVVALHAEPIANLKEASVSGRALELDHAADDGQSPYRAGTGPRALHLVCDDDRPVVIVPCI